MVLARLFSLALFLVLTLPGHASTEASPSPNVELDFENPDTLMDPEEGIRNKNYVRRAILSSMAQHTSRFEFKRPYINHLMGFSAVFQKTSFSKFVTGVQGLSAGYITQGGHGFEAGFELAAISNIFAGYRHIFTPSSFSLWPFLGAGVGTEIRSAQFSDGPQESEKYTGTRKMGFATLGFLIPLVDIGIKAEARFNFYGLDRLVLSSGVGVIFFL